MKTFTQYLLLLILLPSHLVAAKSRTGSVNQQQNRSDAKEVISNQNISQRVVPRRGIMDPELLQELINARRIDASFFLAGNRNVERTPNEAVNRHGH
jgi:hypothetical protein